jgi:hypothetical protein
MKPREVVLLLVLGLALIGWGGFELMQREKTRSRDLAARYAWVIEADRVADPMRRCLDYPAPEWAKNWSPALVESVCRISVPPARPRPDVNALLSADKYSELEAHFDLLKQEHYAGTNEEAIWYLGFDRPFRCCDANQADLGQELEAWVEAMPESANAAVAYGTWLLGRARKVRGTSSYEDIPEERKGEFARLAIEAERLALRAIELDPKHLPAHDLGIQVSMFTPTPGSMRKFLRSGIDAEPHSAYLRLTAMGVRGVEWGGTPAEWRKLRDDGLLHEQRNVRVGLLRARYHLMRGNARYREQDEEGALVEYRRAAELAPDYSAIRYMTFPAADLGQDQLVLEARIQQVRFASTEYWAYKERAEAWQAMGLQKLALADWEAMARVEPTDTWARNKIANWYQNNRRFEEAIASFRLSLAIDPANEYALREYSRILLFTLDDHRQALPLTQRLVELVPEDAEAWLFLANAHKVLNMPEVHDSARRYLELVDPEDPHVQGPLRNVESFLGTTAAEAKRQAAERAAATAQTAAQPPPSRN